MYFIHLILDLGFDTKAKCAESKSWKSSKEKPKIGFIKVQSDQSNNYKVNDVISLDTLNDYSDPSNRYSNA